MTVTFVAAVGECPSSLQTISCYNYIKQLIPKRLKAKLQQLAVTNAVMFQQQDVCEVTVAGVVCIQATQLQ